MNGRIPRSELILPRGDPATPRRRQLGFFTPMGLFGRKNCDAVTFDGTNDYLTRGGGLTGAADSARGIFSAWLRIDGGNGTTRRFFSAASSLGGAVNGPRFSLNASNQFLMTAVAAGTSTAIVQQRSSAYVSSSAWRHLLCAWDMTVPTMSLYVDDVDDQTITANTIGTVDYTYPDWVVGATADGTFKFNGCIAELYFAPGQYLDFSVQANRRKFRSTGGKPAHLGAGGHGPTGTPPLVYMHINEGQAASAFAANRGAGGSFSVSGSLDTASTNPCD